MSGHVHIGEFKQDQRDGKGKFILSDGTTFEGIWTEDSLNSNGTAQVYIKSRGQHFVFHGGFLNGTLHGRGSLEFNIDKGNETLEGTWNQGRLKSGAVYLNSNLFEINTEEMFKIKITFNKRFFFYLDSAEPQLISLKEQTISKEDSELIYNTTTLIQEIIDSVEAAGFQLMRAAELVKTQILPFETPHLSPSETVPLLKEKQQQGKKERPEDSQKTQKPSKEEF